MESGSVEMWWCMSVIQSAVVPHIRLVCERIFTIPGVRNVLIIASCVDCLYAIPGPQKDTNNVLDRKKKCIFSL